MIKIFKNVIFYLFVIIIFTVVIVLNCTIPTTGSKNDTNKKGNHITDPYLEDLSDVPEKEGILSEKEAAINGFNYAWEHGFIKVLMEDFPDTYQDIRIGDMFLVEDNIDGDYYYVLGEHKDGTVAAMAILDAITGKVLESGTLYEESRLVLSNKEDAKKYIFDYASNKSKIKDIKPIFIRNRSNYDRLINWKWAVILEEKTYTRQGSRAMFFVTPFSTGSSKITKTDLPCGNSSRLSVFQNDADENKYLKNKNYTQNKNIGGSNYESYEFIKIDN